MVNPTEAIPGWSVLLSADTALEHRTRRYWFEKRIVRLGAERYVLYRFLVPQHARRLALLLETAGGWGANVQRHLGHIDHWPSALRHKGYWVAATYEPGTPLDGVATEALMGALGGVLAKFHRMESPRAERLFQLTPSFSSYPRRLRGELFAAVRQAEIRAAERQEIFQWIDEQSAFLEEIRSYQLAHGDLYGKNLIIQSRDRLALVDYELAEFEPAGMELATALLRAFCGQLPSLRRSLLKSYLDECAPELIPIWERHAGFFLVAAALRLAAKRRFRARRLVRRGASPEAALNLAKQYDSWATSLIAAHRQGVDNPEALLGFCQ